MEAAIEIKNVSKIFKQFPKKVTALSDINLVIKKGDIFGFLGPNGAGKTTLIKIIIGMLHPNAGEVNIMGIPAKEKSAKLKMGYLPERPYYHDFLTGQEFLEFHGALLSMTSAQLEKRIPEVLEMVGLSKGRNQNLREFSKGMLQRIGLAQALLHDPDVLVLDEPMSGLDPIGRKEVRDLIRRVAASGKTVFFSTHIVGDVEVICSNVGFINQGKLTSIENLNEALNRSIKSFEIKFTATDAAIEALQKKYDIHKVFDGWIFEINAEKSAQEDLEKKINHVIKEIYSEKGVLKSVTPRKGNLEELYFEVSK